MCSCWLSELLGESMCFSYLKPNNLETQTSGIKIKLKCDIFKNTVPVALAVIQLLSRVRLFGAPWPAVVRGTGGDVRGSRTSRTLQEWGGEVAGCGDGCSACCRAWSAVPVSAPFCERSMWAVKFSRQSSSIERTYVWDFPRGPVVKTSRFHCKGHGFNPWSGNLRPHMLGSAAEKTKQNCDLFP